MLGEFGEQTQAKKNAICDKLIAQYEADEQAALKRKLVLVQISKRRYQVIRLNGTTATHPGAMNGVFRGVIVFQGTREDALIFILVNPTPESP